MLNLTLLAAAAAASFQEPAKLSLDEALKVAESNAFSVKLAQSGVEKTRQRIFEVRSQQGPKLTLGSSYSRIESSGSTFPTPKDQSQAQLTFSMPLDITGVIGRGIRASEVALRAAEATESAARNDLRQRVRSAYFRVLQAQALEGVAAEALRNARERLAVTQKEYEAQTKAKIDVLRIETQVRQNESELLAAQNGVRLAKQGLNSTLSRPIETPFDAVDVPDLPKVQTSPEDLVASAIKNRPDVAAQDYNLQALGLVRSAQEGGLYPSLQISANHGRTFGTPSFGGGRSSTTGTIGLTVPLYDSGVTRARVKQARQDEEAARLQLEQLKLGVSLEVRQALSNLQDAWSRYEVAQKSTELAAETYRIAKIRYQENEAIQLEVVDAQTELTRAQSQLVTSRYDYLTAYAALQRAVAADQPAEGGGKL